MNRAGGSEGYYYEEKKRPPWIFEGRMYKAGIEGLCQEIEDFHLVMSNTEKETAVRQQIFKEVRNLVLKQYPDARVEIYGSFSTGLCLPTSDIDITVIRHGLDIQLLANLRDAVEMSGIAKPGSVRLISGAKVPVLKLCERVTDIGIDITVCQENGVKGAEEIKSWCRQWPVLPKLFFVLRQMLLFHGFGDVYGGGIGSYALTLMILSFLNGRNRKKSEKKKNRKVPSDSSGELLIEFLEFFGKTFDYASLAVNAASPKIFVPKDETQMDQSEWSALIVVDPLDSTSNVTRSSFAALEVREFFASAANTLQQMVIRCRRFFPENGFLDRDYVLHVPDLSDRRAKIVAAYSFYSALASHHGISQRNNNSSEEEPTDDPAILFVGGYDSTSSGADETVKSLCMKQTLFEQLLNRPKFGSAQ